MNLINPMTLKDYTDENNEVIICLKLFVFNCRYEFLLIFYLSDSIRCFYLSDLSSINVSEEFDA